MLKRFVACAVRPRRASPPRTAQASTGKPASTTSRSSRRRRRTTGDKIEVLEVFSYACPACNAFQPVRRQDRRRAAGERRDGLSAGRVPLRRGLAGVPARVLRRAGARPRRQDARRDVRRGLEGRLAQDQRSGHAQARAARCRRSTTSRKFYAKYGVKAEDFVGTANSFAVNAKMKRADAQIKAYGVDSTPTIIVNGKYRLTA